MVDWTRWKEVKKKDEPKAYFGDFGDRFQRKTAT
jgi:hypothetical protein